MNEELEEMNVQIEQARPQWTDSVEVYDAAAIQQGGCASGAYMPAVTYYAALQTMAEHGNDVLQYIEDQIGELPQPRPGESWSGMAVFYLSYAVEMWAGQFGIDDIDY